MATTGNVQSACDKGQRTDMPEWALLKHHPTNNSVRLPVPVLCVQFTSANRVSRVQQNRTWCRCACSVFGGPRPGAGMGAGPFFGSLATDLLGIYSNNR